MAESLARSLAKNGWLLLLVAALAAAGCSSKGLTCPEGQTACGDVCVDTQTNPLYCGACNVSCPTGGTCTAGSCACPASLPDRCGLACVNLQADKANCGACGHDCGLGTCSGGSCACNPPSPPILLCTPPVAGSCVDTSSSASHCGACANACLSGEVCSSSTCVCNAPRQICAEGSTSVCADLQTNPRHCGTCTTSCASGENCVAGTCQRSCASGLTLCGDTCVNLQTDSTHCGSCANACLLGQVCSAGTCQSATCTTLRCGSTCCEAPVAGNECCLGACPFQHRNFIGTASAMSYYNCEASYLYRWSVEAAETAARAWAPSGNRISSAQSCVIGGASSLCLVWQKPFALGSSDQGCAVFCYSDSLAGAATVSTTAACPCPTTQQIDWY